MLPPDYTGTAFLPERGVRPEDFPETVIEPVLEKAIPTESPLLPTEVEAEAEAEALPDKSEEESSAPTEESEPPVLSTESDGEPTVAPLLSAEFLRSLTLEDLMLYWLLFMLLSCRQEDQIYLLLGLLLLGR